MQFTPTQKSIAAWGAIAVAFVLLFRLLAPVLAPFVVAAVLAYALTPAVDWLDRLARGRVPRVLAVLVVESDDFNAWIVTQQNITAPSTCNN